jgi:hypothetical protein
MPHIDGEYFMPETSMIERRIAEIAPDDNADDGLTILIIQCHLVGGAIGAALATVICWFAF